MEEKHEEGYGPIGRRRNGGTVESVREDVCSFFKKFDGVMYVFSTGEEKTVPYKRYVRNASDAMNMIEYYANRIISDGWTYSACGESCHLNGAPNIWFEFLKGKEEIDLWIDTEFYEDMSFYGKSNVEKGK